MTATALRLIVNFWHDDCAEDPCDYDRWKVHSFGRHHNNYADPDDVGFEHDDDGDLAPGAELQAKLDAGLAFFLSYYEHGQCVWSLRGNGPQCRWDSVDMAGILVWEQDEGNLGPKTFEAREKDAKAFLDRYTAWCNGYVYGFSIDVKRPCCECGQDVEVPDDEHEIETVGCGGFYIDGGNFEALDNMLSCVKENIGADWANYEVEFTEHNAYGIAGEAEDRWEVA